MRKHHHSDRWPAPSLPFVLMCILLSILWLAGGATRADVFGQVFVRTGAWIILIVAILFAKRPSFYPTTPVSWFLLTAILLAAAQLVPLPAGIWQALPGRAILADAEMVSGGQSSSARPWSIVPAATGNALSALIVPAVTLILLQGLERPERARLPGLILGLIFASTLVGLWQFSAGGIDNPFVNDSPGEVAGTFANRNHFALFVAFGCLVAPVWAFLRDQRSRWRGPAALGLVLLFALTILATGSRAGLILGAVAIALGLTLSRHGISRALRHYPRWTLPVIIAASVGLVGIIVLTSVIADRAVSIERALAIDLDQDMRSRGFSTVSAMIQEYFPFGSGLGSFDPVFRMHEPTDLLKLTYFNHAHNDFLEVVLDAGLAGLALILAALGWWAWASVRAWRGGSDMHHTLPKLGSALLLLVFIASIFDYPARAPMTMAMIVIAAVWLSQRPATAARAALPEHDQHL